jgi:AraC-like DNA-binding protein
MSLSTFNSFLLAINQESQSNYVLHEKLEETFPFHAHQKGQLSYTEGGIAYLNTRDKAYFLPARHYVWIPAGLEHFVQQKSSPHIVRNIYFPIEENAENSFFNQMGIYPVNKLLLEMLRFTESWKGEIEPGTYQSQFLDTMKYLLPEISTHPLPVVLPTTENERLEPVIKYLQQHLSNPLTLPQVAAHFSFSVRSLSRLFQQSMGISFLQYLKLSRIIRAVEELLQTHKSISEIAYDVGYNSISAFSNTFYQLIRMRPTEFQKLNLP